MKGCFIVIKKILKWTAISWAVLAVVFLAVALMMPDDEVAKPVTEQKVEAEVKPEPAKEKKVEKAAPVKSVEERIAAELKDTDEVQFTEDAGFVFVKARAVSEKESVAREKLYRTVEVLAQFKEIDKAVINVQTPDGNRLLYKYKISGDKLHAIDFSVPGYGKVFEAADKLNSTY